LIILHRKLSSCSSRADEYLINSASRTRRLRAISHSRRVRIGIKFYFTDQRRDCCGCWR